MTRIGRMIFSAGLGAFGLPGAAWAHHPVLQVDGSWAWLGLLVAVLAFAVIWAFLVLGDRRKSPKSERNQPPQE